MELNSSANEDQGRGVIVMQICGKCIKPQAGFGFDLHFLSSPL